MLVAPETDSESLQQGLRPPTPHKRNPMAAKKTSSKTSKAKPQDAIAMLRADHKKVSEMFEKYEGLRSEKQKEELALKICKELTVHAQLEEEIIYPAAREAIDDEDLMDEAVVEHQSAKELIAQIEESSPDEEFFDAKVKVLGEYIKHHVKEEQNEMFPEMKSKGLDLKALGEQLRLRKAELLKGDEKSRTRASSSVGQRVPAYAMKSGR